MAISRSGMGREIASSTKGSKAMAMGKSGGQTGKTGGSNGGGPKVKGSGKSNGLRGNVSGANKPSATGVKKGRGIEKKGCA